MILLIFEKCTTLDCDSPGPLNSVKQFLHLISLFTFVNVSFDFHCLGIYGGYGSTAPWKVIVRCGCGWALEPMHKYAVEHVFAQFCLRLGQRGKRRGVAHALWGHLRGHEYVGCFAKLVQILFLYVNSLSNIERRTA